MLILFVFYPFSYTAFQMFKTGFSVFSMNNCVRNQIKVRQLLIFKKVQNVKLN
jgi:hypothetical protein